MRICVVVPAIPTQRSGNRTTGERWRRLLSDLGHDVAVVDVYNGRPVDVLVALHAHKSAASVAAFRTAFPGRPVVVALTGTDLYRDLARSEPARRSLEAAARLVVLQPRALEQIPQRLRGRAHVIPQSAQAVPTAADPADDAFEVVVIAHLRWVKDPLRAAAAARLVPTASKLRVIHLGGALEAGFAERARREAATNPRYQWRGEVPHDQALATLARSRLLVLTSLLEGGANVVSEAIVAGVPVVSSRIPGSVGMLGEDYPGYFPAGATRALAELLWRVETDDGLYRELAKRVEDLQPAYQPERERDAWQRLLAGIA